MDPVALPGFSPIKTFVKKHLSGLSDAPAKIPRSRPQNSPPPSPPLAKDLSKARMLSKLCPTNMTGESGNKSRNGPLGSGPLHKPEPPGKNAVPGMRPDKVSPV